MSTAAGDGIDPGLAASAPEAQPGTFEIGTDGLNAVVVGYDGTDPAQDALAFAAGLARRNRARLLVAYVIAFGAASGLAPSVAALREEAGREEAARIAGQVAAIARELGVEAECVVRHGEVARELEAYAEEQRADAIVVGRSGSRTHAVIGSVAVALVKHARRPVTVVP